MRAFKIMYGGESLDNVLDGRLILRFRAFCPNIFSGFYILSHLVEVLARSLDHVANTRTPGYLPKSDL